MRTLIEHNDQAFRLSCSRKWGHRQESKWSLV